MTTRRTAPWIKDALGRYVQPGYVIAAGMTGTTLMKFMVVESIYLDKADGTPYGTSTVHSDSVVLKHLDDSFYTESSDNFITYPKISLKGRCIYSDKSLSVYKTFSISSVTVGYNDFNNFIRVAEDFDEFQESLIFQ